MTPEELYEAVAVDLLPDLPNSALCDSGYEWMELLHAERTGWREVPGNADGCLFGNWPYQVVAHYDDDERSLYGLAVYTEGDARVEGFRDRAARNKATNAYVQDDD